mgnify:FL=1
MRCPRPFGDSHKRCGGELVLVVRSEAPAYYCTQCLHTMLIHEPCGAEYRRPINSHSVRCVQCGHTVVLYDEKKLDTVRT